MFKMTENEIIFCQYIHVIGEIINSQNKLKTTITNRIC